MNEILERLKSSMPGLLPYLAVIVKIQVGRNLLGDGGGSGGVVRVDEIVSRLLQSTVFVTAELFAEYALIAEERQRFSAVHR